MSTAIYVAYATRTLDLTWLPETARIVIVHNDDELDRGTLDRQDVIHVDAPGNVGFGAGVNLALSHVTTTRVVLCNPDIGLARRHWEALLDAGPDDVVTVPLVDVDGRLTSVASCYPTAASHLASGYRLGRLAPRGSRTRAVLTAPLGRWGRAHEESLHRPVGTWPLHARWLSGAVLSVDAARMRAIGGFDDRYFLYYEDVDLCRRLSQRFPASRARVADVAPGIHRVGGSAVSSPARSAVERIRLDSAVRYAQAQPGPLWTACATLLRARRRVAA